MQSPELVKKAHQAVEKHSQTRTHYPLCGKRYRLKANHIWLPRAVDEVSPTAKR